MSIANILNKVFADQKQAKVSAEQEYKSLLHKYAGDDAKLTKADQQRLGELIATLKKTERQASEDDKAIRQYYDLQQLGSNVDTLATAYETAVKVRDKTLLNRQEQTLKMNADCSIASQNADQAWHDLDRSRKASIQAKEITDVHPHLF